MSLPFILLIVILVFVLILKLSKRKILGIMGEAKCSSILRRLPKDKYNVVNDILIKHDKGTTQIDHVVVSIYGIFVIETKNYNGKIYGNDTSDNWTKSVYGKHFPFYNPIKQNYGHIKAIKNFLHLQDTSKIRGIVSFSNRATLKVHTKSNVVLFKRLKRTIMKYDTPLLSSEEVREYTSCLENACDYSKEAKRAHVKEVKSKVRDKRTKIKQGVCPSCGSKLKKKRGLKGSYYKCCNPRCSFIQTL